MNLRRGFKRIAFVLVVVTAIICAGLSVGLVLLIRSSAQTNLRWKQKNYRDKYKVTATKEQLIAELKRREALNPEDRVIEEKRRSPISEEKAKAKAELEELENGFWVTLSIWGLVGLCISGGLTGGAMGYCFIWFIYKLLEWLVLGFCGDTS